MDVGLSGLASGFDWHSLIDQLIEVERAPEQRLRDEQSLLQQRDQAYSSIKSQLLVFQGRVQALQDPALFEGRTAQSSDPAVGSVQAAAGVRPGSYSFLFTQLAAAARQRGVDDIAKPISSSSDVSQVTLNSATFDPAIKPGTFTVNGQQISVTASETLQSVFDKISAATKGDIRPSYSTDTDEISLVSDSPILLGSSTDSSNFLQVAKLYDNGSREIKSAGALGGVNLSSKAADANLRKSISNGANGAGEFKINGVSIAFDASTDSVQDILDRINDSQSGVTATYDGSSDRFTLANKETGDVGFALEDISGNFLTATGLRTGSLERGKNLLYSIDGSEQLVSRSNTITADSSGVEGLLVTALKEGTVTATVQNDPTGAKAAINSFLTEYNKVQSIIATQTASSTGADGKVTAGILAGDGDADAIGSKLRSLVNTALSGLAGKVSSLANLGINSNGNDNNLSLDDEGKLDAALAQDLAGVKGLFADASKGLAVTLNDYLNQSAGDDGFLPTKQANITKQSASIDTQVADFERRVLADKQRLTDSFVAMETAEAKINQQLQYLKQRFASTT